VITTTDRFLNHEHVLHQVAAGGLEVFLGQAVVDQLARLGLRQTQREVAVLWRHRRFANERTEQNTVCMPARGADVCMP
jgi:hypothetical protein